jgi:hypothetical protein
MLMNYVALEKDVPTRMHFTDHYFVEREVWDEKLGKFKMVRSLVFWVDELNGEPAAKSFSILSDALSRILSGYIPNHSYVEFDFLITKQGEGFATRYQVQTIPKPQ